MEFDRLYRGWVKSVCEDESIISSTDHVILDSFGEAILDMIRIFNPYLQEYDLHNEEIKNNYWVQLSTGKVVTDPESLGGIRKDPGHIDFEVTVNGTIVSDQWYLTIRDYILYWADRVIKRFFGENILLHSTIATNELLGSKDHRIYWDVRTQGEMDYIKDSGGLLIHLVSPGRIRKRGYQKIRDLHPDLTINTTKPLETLSHTFWEEAGIIRSHENKSNI